MVSRIFHGFLRKEEKDFKLHVVFTLILLGFLSLLSVFYNYNIVEISKNLMLKFEFRGQNIIQYPKNRNACHISK